MDRRGEEFAVHLRCTAEDVSRERKLCVPGDDGDDIGSFCLVVWQGRPWLPFFHGRCVSTGLGFNELPAPSIYFVSLTWKIDENGRIGTRRRLSNTAIWLPSLPMSFICILFVCIIILLSLSVSLSADNANC